MRYKNAAELEGERMQRLGNKISAARKRGICTHGWLQGTPGNDDGPVKCLHCGAMFQGFTAAYAANREAIDNL